MSKTQLTAEPGKQELFFTHTFDAPRDVVFKIYTDPNLIPQWWGPRYLTTTVDRMEARPGGQWRFIQREPSGSEYGFHGVYHQVVAPERMIYTFEFEGMPGHVILETADFKEQDGQTVLTVQSVYQSVADRDGMIAAGMEMGERESMERLTELLVKMA